MDLVILLLAVDILGGVWSAPSPDVAVSALRLEPPHVDAGSLPVSYVSKYHAQDELGQVSYGYSHPGQAKDETRDASGNVAGVYTYVDNNNKLTRVEYTAGQEGFQVRSNNLPVQTNDTPEVLAAKLKFVEAYNGAAYAAATADDAKSEKTSQAALPFASQSVKDTPEVIAAKLQFLEAYNAAAIAAAIANDAESNDTSRAIITYAFHPVQDTPEVTAAKLKFVEAYNAAALAAAAANDSESNDISKIISSYATHVVQDTPEVIAAKLKFFEAYNAAAIAAASAPDDAVTSITVKPNANESRRDSIQTSPRTRKFNVLRPVKVIDTPNIEAENNEKNYNTVPFATTLASNDVLFRLSVNLNSNEPVTAISETSTEEKQEATVSPNEDKYGELATIIPYIIESPLRSSRSRKYPELIPVKMPNTPNTEVENNIYSTKVPQVHSQGAIPSVQAQPEETTVPIFPAIQSAIPTVTYQTPDLGLPFMYVSRHHVQDELGRVDYGFSYPGQSKHEVRDSSGNVIGVYSYSDDDNKLLQVEYTAGKDGVTVKSNILPESVTDTPEVLAAKHQFVEAYNSAAIAAAAAPNRDSVDSIKLVFNNPVKDTAIQDKEQFPDSTLAKTGNEDVPVIQRPLVIVPVTYTTQYHTQDELGRVRYGFSYPGHTKYEVRDATGNVAGAYSYMTPEDKVIQVVYTAGDNGFQVYNNLTVAAENDTSDVLDAKLQFVEAYNAAALAADANPDNDGIPHENRTVSAIISPILHNQVKDTPEVLAAKLKFAADYNAAAYAPDDLDISHSNTQIDFVPYVKPNHIQDTPAVIAAKIQFIEAHNKAALATRNENSEGDSSGTLTYAIHSVQDTPEVIAAKLQFVEAYNAAAIAAALAPDDGLGENNTINLTDEPFASSSDEENLIIAPGESDADILENIKNGSLGEGYENQNASGLSEVSQSQENMFLMATPVVNDQYTNLYRTSPAIPIPQYSSYSSESIRAPSLQYTNLMPVGLYSFPSPLASTQETVPKTDIREIPFPSYVHRRPIHLADYYFPQQHAVYAPMFTSWSKINDA